MLFDVLYLLTLILASLCFTKLNIRTNEAVHCRSLYKASYRLVRRGKIFRIHLSGILSALRRLRSCMEMGLLGGREYVNTVERVQSHVAP